MSVRIHNSPGLRTIGNDGRHAALTEATQVEVVQRLSEDILESAPGLTVIPVDNLTETIGSHIALDKGNFDQSRLQKPSEVTPRVIGINR